MLQKCKFRLIAYEDITGMRVRATNQHQEAHRDNEECLGVGTGEKGEGKEGGNT
jgi:hypothetical protein